MNEENKHVWVQHVVDDVKKNKKKSANRALVWPCRAHRADHELSPTEAAQAEHRCFEIKLSCSQLGHAVITDVIRADGENLDFRDRQAQISFLAEW